MWDDDHDKSVARKQMIGMFLIMALFLLWMNFFAPKGPSQTAAPAIPANAPVEQPGATALPEASAEEGGAETPGHGMWAALPPAAAQGDPAEDEITIENEDLRLVFTRVGARLKQAYVLLGPNGVNTVQLVPEPAEEASSGAQADYPLGLEFSNDELDRKLDTRRFEAERDPAGKSVTFSLTVPGAATVQKSFRLPEQGRVVDVEVAYRNLAETEVALGYDQDPAFTLYWGPNVASGDLGKGTKQSLVWRTAEGNQTLATADLPQDDRGRPERKSMVRPEWIAVKSAYFLVALRPDFEEAKASAIGTVDAFEFGVAAPSVKLAAGEAESRTFQLYVGPNEFKSLRQAWPTLSTALRFFEKFDMMDRFAKLLLGILNWFYGFIPNYGVAVILLTVLVRVVMYPLTLKSMRSMKKMQMLAPEMEELKKQYGEDPQELQKKMMELYRERGINPLGGCFPILLQMPVFIALYRMLWNAYELRGAHFMLWITDLSEPDRLFYIPALEHLPLIGAAANINVLPLLMGGAMVLSQKVTPTSGPVQNPQQRMMMIFMPVFFSLICYNMASGLNLYILTSTVLGMVQQYFTRPGDMDVKKQPAVRKKQHWYAAVQARKREMRKISKGK